MRKASKKISILAVLAVLGGLTVVAPSASAQTTYEIRIGTTRLPDIRTGASMRFFPSRITVHEGDSLHFVTGALHTATLLPTGQDAQDWVDTNATEQDQPFSAIANDPDDGPGALKASAGAFVSNRTDCGFWGNGSPCPFDGTSVLNSGAAILPGQEFDFTAVVNVPAGESFWVVCLVHPDMRMKVDVVAAGVDTTDQSDIDAQRTNQIARDNDWALAADRRLERQTSHRTASGRTVRDVIQGFDNQFASLNETYPKRLTIRRGQRVRFHFDNLNFETHSATFPPDFGRWFGQIETFNPVCDTDGDLGTDPDEPPGDPSDPQNVCPGGPSQLEQDFEARSGQGAGNGVVSNRTGLENSGIRGVATQRFESFDVRFTRRSGRRGPFTFFCFFHGGSMFTRVRVR
jgi:plastocyanin